MSTPADSRQRTLASQAFFLGLFSGLLVVPTSSVFLGEFGAENLPWTYIAVAGGALVGTPALARAVRRRTLAEIGVPLWLVIAAGVGAAWVGLEWFDAYWVSAPLFVLFPMGILVGFFLIGGQAGRVFDVREMKEQFPRIVVGLPLGFLVAGLLGDALITVLGGVERLLPVAAVAAAALATLIAAAARWFPDVLGRSSLTVIDVSSPPADQETRSVPLRRLLSNRFVAVLLGYQMLSQLGSQLVDFLMFDRAAARFDDADELGRFVARYTIGLNLLNLIFLLFVAGALIKRFGMRVGLTANPFVVTTLMVGAVVAAAVTGVGGLTPFVLILAARAFDIAFTDGATRTALNTAYQAVAPSRRLAAQATIEGFGVPIALGLTGVILLVLQQGVGVGAWGISLLTVGVCVVWTGAGLLVFSAYRTALRDGLEQRVLSPAALDLDEPTTAAEVDRMLGSDDERTVWAALVVFGSMESRHARLRELTQSRHPGVAEAALTQLAVVDPDAARVAAESAAHSSLAVVRLAANGVLVGRGGGDTTAIADALDDPDAAVRAAARRAAARSGNDELLDRLTRAATIGVDPASAVTALSAAGDDLVPHAVNALRDDDSRSTLRVLGAMQPSPEAARALAPYVSHRNRDVAVAVRRLIARGGDLDLGTGVVDTLLVDDATFAARALAAIVALPPDPRVAVLSRSLADELDLASRGMMASLAIMLDHALVADAERAARSGDEHAVARAIEALDVHLDSSHSRLCMPVIEVRRPATARLASLRAIVDVPVFDLDTVLLDLEADPEGRWRRPWLATCARAMRDRSANRPADAPW